MIHPGEIRTYAFDRFLQVSITNSNYAIPDGFDVKKYFADYIEAEVLSPQPLRVKFADIIAKLHAKYTK